VIAQNAITTQGIYSRRPQNHSTRIDLASIFTAWSDITNTALRPFFVLADEVTSYFVPAATRIEQAKSARLTIKELADLKENWDGYGAAPISERTRDNALLFVDLIEAAPYGLPAPEICPKPNGTISFEWETPRVEAYLEIGNTRYSGFVNRDYQPAVLLEGHAESMDQQIVAVVHTAMSLTAIHPASITEIHTTAPKHEHLAL
jgi:hypothetical protein